MTTDGDRGGDAINISRLRACRPSNLESARLEKDIAELAQTEVRSPTVEWRMMRYLLPTVLTKVSVVTV
jgi:hypothetical protein